MRTAVMRKVHIHFPKGHLECIQQMAENEGIAFAEMARRCLHLGMMELLKDKAAFLKAVDEASQVQERIERTNDQKET